MATALILAAAFLASAIVGFASQLAAAPQPTGMDPELLRRAASALLWDERIPRHVTLPDGCEAEAVTTLVTRI